MYTRGVLGTYTDFMECMECCHTYTETQCILYFIVYIYMRNFIKFISFGTSYLCSLRKMVVEDVTAKYANALNTQRIYTSLSGCCLKSAPNSHTQKKNLRIQKHYCTYSYAYLYM